MSFLEKLDRLADNIDIRDENLVLMESMSFLFEETRSRNIYWIRKNKDAGQEIVIDLKPVEEGETGICSFSSARPDTIQAIEQSIQNITVEMAKKYKSNWLEKSEVLVTDLAVVLPIFSGTVALGHFLIIGESEGEEAQQKLSEKELVSFQRFLKRTLNYAFQLGEERRLTYEDTLTPLFNQRYLSRALDREIYRADRYERPFSVLFFDIDNFKRVNDKHGHLTGSEIIREMGKLLKDSLRESDYGFRFGGDEFLVILVETAMADAQKVAERIRAMVEAKVFQSSEAKHKLTVSIGVASYPDHGNTKEQILSLADQAMYYGKRSSKNVVYVAC